MDEFEFFGVANGQAVVRHRGEGHVFRFAPTNRLDWDALSLHLVEPGEATSDDPEPHVEGALRFASQSVFDVLSRKPEGRDRSRRRWFLSRVLS